MDSNIEINDTTKKYTQDQLAQCQDANRELTRTVARLQKELDSADDALIHLRTEFRAYKLSWWYRLGVFLFLVRTND